MFSKADKNTDQGAVAGLENSFQRILQDNVSILRRVPAALPGGADGYGFTARHIQRLLRLVRLAGDPDLCQPDLKLILLQDLLGDDLVHQIWFGGETYFLSSYNSWTAVLGKEAEVVDALGSASSAA